ncbi:hypothetical protein CEUSTIGMA_g3729.t1 [Chlamydomonas eustigma]|uniref:SBP-type domain-containing protein n=1 Tax=Chlamydomonas eustigma TaxID=1157962 RepID=A0A250WZL0_9CHLO|nr:hypothetical protein CEUSTIGMA_g3729.t1 [Chlamydomonas eustigma]|eukprot:GAX76284.1 hypothetical protein CEUSTIGMA_g3729.t1 [Chlamydomonas eustigma]
MSGGTERQTTDWNPFEYVWDPFQLVAGTDLNPQVLRNEVAGNSRSESLGATQPLGISTSHSSPLAPLKRPSGSLSHQNKGPPTCQVDGCKTILTGPNFQCYHRRNRVCTEHMRVLSTEVGGQESRYCQQCHKFHEMSAFDANKRSCRMSLQRRSDKAAAKSAAKAAGHAYRKSPREAQAPGSSGASRAIAGKQQLLSQLAEGSSITQDGETVKTESHMHGGKPGVMGMTLRLSAPVISNQATGILAGLEVPHSSRTPLAPQPGSAAFPARSSAPAVALPSATQMQGPILELSDWARNTLKPVGSLPGVPMLSQHGPPETGQDGMGTAHAGTSTVQDGGSLFFPWSNITSPEWHSSEPQQGELRTSILDSANLAAASERQFNGQLPKPNGEVLQMMEAARSQLVTRSPLQQLPAQRALLERTGLQLDPNPPSGRNLQAVEGMPSAHSFHSNSVMQDAEGAFHQTSPPIVLERLCIKMYGVTPDALPLDLLHRLQGWINTSGLDVVQASLRPGCTMLVLDMIMEEGDASSASGQLLHPFMEATGLDPSKNLETILGPAVIKAAEEIRMQAGCQVAKLQAKLVEGGKMFVAQDSCFPCQLGPESIHRRCSPHLQLAYPRCLLAGQVLSPLTLTISTSDDATQVRVFARHNGMFLPSSFEQEVTSSTPSTSSAGGASLACVILDVPGSQSYPASWLMTARTGEQGRADERTVKRSSMNDIFFDLHSPETQGLIAIEFEVPDGSLSNWKPILVVDDEEVVCELRALALPQGSNLDMQVEFSTCAGDNEELFMRCSIPEPLPEEAEVETFLIDMGLLLQVTTPGSALLGRPHALRWGMMAARRCHVFIETWQSLSLDTTSVLLAKCWDRLLTLTCVSPSASTRDLIHSGHASVSSVCSSFQDLHPERSVQRLESSDVDRSSCDGLVKGPDVTASVGFSISCTGPKCVGSGNSSAKHSDGDRISPISPVPMHSRTSY